MTDTTLALILSSVGLATGLVVIKTRPTKTVGDLIQLVFSMCLAVGLVMVLLAVLKLVRWM